MPASGPGITDIKLLFARSGNRCAFPKCRAPMAVNQTLTGEVCHIKGARPRSARYDPGQTDVERHAYANLVLMCPTHHTVIDDDAEAYTVERLCKIKAAHEAQSAPIPDAEAAAVAEVFIQSVTNIGQSGGLSAHTVNASTITVQSAPSTSHLTRQRQIQAVEHLWQVVRNLSSEFGLVVFVDSILTPSELDAYFRKGEYAHIADCIREYADMNLPLRKFSTAGANDAAKERPFVTNRLWSTFFVLQGLYGRTALLLTNSYKERRFVSWRTDTGCDQLLRAILPCADRRARERASDRRTPDCYRLSGKPVSCRGWYEQASCVVGKLIAIHAAGLGRRDATRSSHGPTAPPSADKLSPYGQCCMSRIHLPTKGF